MAIAPSRRKFLAQAGSVALAAPLAGSRLPAAHAFARQPRPRPAGGGETVLAFAGDLFLTSAFPQSRPPQGAEVFDAVREAAAAFANLENGLSTKGTAELGGYKWGPALRGDPSLVGELTASGIDAVSVANNHSGNYGREALLETLETLDTARVKHAGAGRDVNEAFAPAFLTVNGLTIAFFSVYSCHYGRVSQEVAGDSLPGVACVRAYDVMLEMPGRFEPRAGSAIFDAEVNAAQSVMAPLKEDVLRLQAAIQKARSQADLAVLYVHFHWGRHTRPGLPFHQRVVAHAAVDAGIDLFIAHGPHVVRGVELYRGRPVLYSIGNFVLQAHAGSARPSASALPLSEQSVLVRARIAAGRAIELEFLPLVFAPDGQPRFARDQIGAAIVQRLAGLSAEFDTIIDTTEWYGSLRIPSGAASKAAVP